jgi:CofD-related protein of GAK system
MDLSFTRTIETPDPHRFDPCRYNPGCGPRILFFSGGTSLRETSRELIQYTHNSIHLVAATDSGGSSAVLRDAFGMPAIGDLRQRLLALADHNWAGNAAVFQLFSHRLDKTAPADILRNEIASMKSGGHPLVAAVSEPVQAVIRRLLASFLERMPTGFDLRGANIGNLILAGGYLEQGRRLGPIIRLFSDLVHVRGIVRPITERYLHLAAELESGETLIGQHRLTGKEAPPIQAPVRRIFLTSSLDERIEVDIPLAAEIAGLISRADLICYPMGSFYSSLLANLFLRGMGSAIRANPCPKVFIPNTWEDPELIGKTLDDQVKELLRCLKKDDPQGIADSEVLNLVLVDGGHVGYRGGLDGRSLQKRGIEVADCRLVSPLRHPLIDERLLVPMVLSLI